MVMLNERNFGSGGGGSVEGSNNRRPTRIGRGIGSGRGKTGGRGGKGQTARSGVAINGFEGGQTPRYRRVRKEGFRPYDRVEFACVGLGDIIEKVKSGEMLLSESGVIDGNVLVAAGMVARGSEDNIKILGCDPAAVAGSNVFAGIAFQCAAYSKTAREVILGTGGKIL